MKQKIIFSLIVSILETAALVHADPVTSSTNPYNLLTQPRLMGDCYGCRPIGETHGVVLSAQSTSDLFGNTTGGAATGTTYSGLMNLGLAIDLQKAVGWEGASFKSTWLWLYGSDVSNKYVGNAFTVSNVAGNPTFRAYELWFQQNFFHDLLSLRSGVLGLDTEFMNSDAASFFLNSTFGVLSTFSLNVPNGGPIYPQGTPGVRLALQPTAWLTLRSAISQANPFSQTQNSHGFDWNFGTSGGLLSLSEVAATWNKEADSKRLPGTAKAGLWLQEGRDSQSSSGSFNFASPNAQKFSSGYYGIIDQQLYAVPDQAQATSCAGNKNPVDPNKNPPAPACSGKGLSGFARIAFSPDARSISSLCVNAGLLYTGLIPTRDADKLGVAFGYAQVGSAYASLGSSQGLPGVGYEALAELSYAMQLTPAVSIQPDLQYVLHPGGTQQYGNALVIGVRAVVSF